jgi:peptidyl-prolyl cis-trans isomerase A (cyclophilin A)
MSRFRLPNAAIAAAPIVLLAACGGGGSDEAGGDGRPTVTSASVGAAKYSQAALVTINGTSLEGTGFGGTTISVASPGCTGMARSTTAPNVSSATTAYYTCTVKAIGAQTVTITRTSDGATLATAPFTVPAPQVTMTVSDGAGISGSMVFTLAPDKTPITVDNFLAYVNSAFYDGTVFHRVVKGFVIQGGGYLASGALKTPTLAPIVLEVNKGLTNVQWTVAMARTSDANSATSQFFVNTVNNSPGLDPGGFTPEGYAVFGSLTTNTALAAAIENAACSPPGSTCKPLTPIVVTSARQTQ